MIKTLLPLIITANLTAAAITLAILVSGAGLSLPTEDAEAIGGTMTLVLVLMAIGAQMKAREGKLPGPLLALIVLPGPIYAYLGGSTTHVIGYHAVGLAIHGLVLYSAKKAEERVRGGKS